MEPHIERNIARWKLRQALLKEKKEKREALAKSQLLKELGREPKHFEILSRVKFILAERKAKWMLKERRATIGEIVKAHQQPKGEK